MKIWILFFFCLFASNFALAEESYQAIYQVKPSTEGFSGEFSKIKPFYEQRIKQDNALDDFHTPANTGNDRESLGIDIFDLNEDGQKEIFVSMENHLECGSHGCAFDIYQLSSDGHLKTLFTGIAEAPIVLNSISRRYHDLVFSGSEKGESFYTIYRFDGKHYVRAERINADQLQ